MSRLTPMRDEDQPRINKYYAPRKGNFPVPGAQSTEPPTYCLRVNVHWFAHVQGLLMALDQQDAWKGSAGEIEFARNEARKLIASMEVCGDDAIDMGELENCVMPVGTIMLNAVVPDGWMECDGRHLLATDYPDLYAAWGGSQYVGLISVPASPYYLQNGIILPDLRARVPVGNTDTDPIPDFYKADLAAGISSRDIGQSGGAETHTLTESQLPVLSPRVTAVQDLANTALPGTTRRFAQPASTIYSTVHTTPTTLDSRVSFGGGQSHNNMQPFHVLRYIVKVVACEPEPGVTMSYITRQNPENPCLYEYSIDGGTTWITSFDFDLCLGDMKDQIDHIEDIVQNIETLISDIGTSTETNNTTNIWNIINEGDQVLNEYNETYDNTVISIAPDLVMGNEDNGVTDADRNAVLCYACAALVDIVCDMAIETFDNYQDNVNLWGVIVNGALAAVAVFATGGLALGILAALAGSAAVSNALQLAITTLGKDTFQDLSARSEVACCMYNALKDQTVERTVFETSLDGDCGFSFGSHASQIAGWIKDALILEDLNLYLAWLKATEAAIPLVQLGLYDCQCGDTICEYQDFATDGMGDWTYDAGDSYVAGQGVRGEPAPTYGNARCFRDLGALFEITQIDMTWYCPRTDDAQVYNIEASEDGIGWTNLKHDDYQPIGAQTDSWTGSFTGRYIRLTAPGSFVNTRSGQIIAANVCYK